MAYIVPTVTDFKNHFTRDFPYGVATNTVMDSDISKALDECSVNFNESLWDTQTEFSISYLYLTAHYLVMDLRASTQGIAGNFAWMTTNKSVGSVSEGQDMPEFIKKDPMLSHYAKTYYGAKYISLLYPRLIGNMFSKFGGTKP